MNAADFVEIAGKFAAMRQLTPHDARLRSSVSRAYYGAFHSVSELLRSWNLVVRRNSYGHQDAIDVLRQSRHPLTTKVAGKLDDLRQARIRADYRLEVREFEAIDATSAVEIAADVLAAIEHFARDDELKTALTLSRDS